MKEDKAHLQNEFEQSRSDLITGTLKFGIQYISLFDLYKACKLFSDQDPRVKSLTIRTCGQIHLAVDIQYSFKDLQPEKAYHTFLYEKFQPFMKNQLGGDYLNWWELHDTAYVVK
ncbi:MAG: hypothetical protein Fur003_5390 [Candidatus Dojkabacteria bacterium]